jgi:hypothetical protein
MKTQRTLSNPLFSAIIIAVSAVAAPFSGYAQDTDSHSRRPMTYDRFKAAMELVVRATESGDDCQLKVTESNDGLQLSMKNGETVTVIDVPKDSPIELSTSSISDGSFDVLYTIPGLGAVEEIIVDDLAYSASIKSFLSGKTAHCNIDY